MGINFIMGLSGDQLEELKKAFAAIDANGDGVISKDELSTLLKGLGEDVGDDVVTEMMNLADTDGDGKVNFEEFCKASHLLLIVAEPLDIQNLTYPFLFLGSM